jgi:hypothetical protein
MFHQRDAYFVLRHVRINSYRAGIYIAELVKQTASMDWKHAQGEWADAEYVQGTGFQAGWARRVRSAASTQTRRRANGVGRMQAHYEDWMAVLGVGPD